MKWRRLKTEMAGEIRVLADFGCDGEQLVSRWYDEGAWRVIHEAGIPSGGARYRPSDGVAFFHALLHAFPRFGMFFVEELDTEPLPLPQIRELTAPQRRRRTSTGG